MKPNRAVPRPCESAFEGGPGGRADGPRDGRSFPSPWLCLAILASGVLFVALSPPGVEDEDHPSGSPRAHPGVIEGATFSADGRLAATAGRDGTARVWDVAARRPAAAKVSGLSGFSSVAFSPDGRTLAATGYDGHVVLCDPRDGRKLATLPAVEGGSARVAAFSHDGATLATGGDDRAVRLWDVPSGRERLVLRGHGATVRGLAFDPAGRTLHSASADGLAIAWDVPTGGERGRSDVGLGPLRSIVVSPDGRWAAIGGRDGIALRNLAGDRRRDQTYRRTAVTSLLFLACGTSLASASLDGPITLWKVGDDGLRPDRTPDGRMGRGRALAVSPDGKTMITGGDDAIPGFREIR